MQQIYIASKPQSILNSLALNYLESYEIHFVQVPLFLMGKGTFYLLESKILLFILT